ncbi:DivIVA domain-containing protein [Tessaracoccus sp.]
MTTPRDDREDEDSMTGLNLFDDKASAAGNFPYSMRGYDRHAVDSYVREVEQKATELKVQLRERSRDLAHLKRESGTTDFTRLGAHAKQLLHAAETQAAELVRQGEAEADRIRNEGRRSAAALRESAQREADDVRLSGLAGLRKLRQEQAEAGEAALLAVRRDAELAASEAQSSAQHIMTEATARATTLQQRAEAEAAASRAATESAATQTLLQAQQQAEKTLAEALEGARANEAAIAEQLEAASRHQAEATAQLTAARREAATIRAQAVEATEETRLSAMREAEDTMSAMRARVSDVEARLEEQVAWRKEQLEREISALTARRTAMHTAMQNLREIADESPGNEETTLIPRANEETTVIPRANEETGGHSH